MRKLDYDIEAKDGERVFRSLPENYSGAYEIDDDITIIGKGAFSGCSGLTSIEIPSSVTSIGDGAFCDCSGLTSIEIPSGVTSIGNRAFDGCSGLTSIEIPSSVTSIGDDAFRGCSSLTFIEIPSGVTSIGYEAFRGCSGLTSIEIPFGVTSIGCGAFHGCSGLTSIEIPSGITSIRDDTFYGCSGLKSIDVPDSVNWIGRGAFSGCTDLSRIRILGNYVSIGWPLFSGCPQLKKVTLNERNGRYVIKDGIVYNRAGTELLECIGSMCPEDITVNPKVRIIRRGAFSDMKSIRIIRLPKYLKTIEDAAFDFDSSKVRIIVEAENPADIEITADDSGRGSFLNVTKDCILVVPVGCGYAYRHHPVWGQFDVQVISDDEES